MLKPNKELVLKYLEKSNPAHYDFKLENDCLRAIDNPLERFLVFRRKSTKVPDPDSCELTMSIMCYSLEMQGYKVIGYEDRHIYLNEDIILETDTANSFLSLYKGALMNNVPEYIGLCENLGVKGGFTEHYETIFQNRDKFSLKNNNDKLMDEFIEFAGLTHSIGNFIIGPKGFNKADSKSKANSYSTKKWDKFDRIDLFINKVANGETHDEWKRWFSGNIFSTYLNHYFYDIVYTKDGMIDLKKSKLQNLGNDNFIYRISRINQIILCRGNEIVQDLKYYFRG